jgi:hypothetical protein
MYEIWVNIDCPIRRYEISSVYKVYNKNDKQSMIDQMMNLIRHETHHRLNVGDEVVLLYRSGNGIYGDSRVIVEKIVKEPDPNNKYVIKHDKQILYCDGF